jgi:hypothetical protein
MKIYVSLSLSVLLVSLVACKPAEQSRPTPAAPAPAALAPEAGADLVEFALSRLDGEGVLKLSSLKGSSYYIYVFAPWTDAGQAAGEAIEALAAATGLSVLPAIVDRRGFDAARAAPPSGLPDQLPAVWVDDNFLAAAGAVRSLPTTLLVDAGGKLVRAWPGHAAISNILAGASSPSARR